MKKGRRSKVTKKKKITLKNLGENFKNIRCEDIKQQQKPWRDFMTLKAQRLNQDSVFKKILYFFSPRHRKDAHSVS